MDSSHVNSSSVVVTQNVTLVVLKPRKGKEGYDVLVILCHMDQSPPLPKEGKHIRCGDALYRVTSIIHEYRWYQPPGETPEAITEINIYVEDL